MGGCNWLVLLFTAQLVLFSCFMITFFSMETRRQEEQREMQKELHRLRTDNLAKERKLIKLAERAESWRFDRGGESEDDAGGEFNEDEWSEESDEDPPGEDAYGAEALAPEEEALSAEKRAGCARLKEGWWVYEVCLGQHVRQFHAADAKAAFAENMLGMAPQACGTEEAGCHCMRLREDDAALSCHKAEEEYVRGDACPHRESMRSVTVKLVCREGEEAADSVLAEGALALVSVHEPETCRYEATVEAPAGLCGAAGGDGAAGGGGGGGGSEPLPAATVEEKRQAVVEALRHSWKGYEQYAWGKDELQPVSHKGKDWVGLGLTILDSLDVLWMANLTKEFAHGVEWVRDSLNYERPKPISVFETTIRCLGGMLAAYELSGEKVLLDRSTELGEKLQKAYGAAGLPYTTLSLLTGHKTIPNWTGGSLLLAEVGTVQMEFFALAHHAGKPEFRERAQRAIDLLDSQGGGLTDGGRLWPIHIRPESGRPSGSTISWGAMGDSFYEYLLKTWLLTGKKHEQYKRMYLEAVKGMQRRLIIEEGGLTYLCEEKSGKLVRKMDHLVCFVPGTLALGAQHLPEQHDEHMALAAKLAETCHRMYTLTPTGLAPEFVKIDREGSMVAGANHNLLRPETIEAFFYLWRFTKDARYREWGWEIFSAFERHCRVPSGGYSGLKNVKLRGSAKDDTMQTFWLAESLKYFLLLFSDDSLLDLNTHVINTEAHPIKILPS